METHWFLFTQINPCKIKFTTTIKELLSIVEALKELRTILLGNRITLYTDHKNLSFDNFTTEKVLCWRPILE